MLVHQLALIGTVHGYQLDCADPAWQRILLESDTWNVLWGIYRSSTGANVSENLPPGGYQVPYAIKIIEGIGRAPVATAPVRKGQLVYRGSHNDVVFSESEYRSFISAVPQKNYCDILHWTYCDASGARMVFDDSSFENHDEDFNIGGKDLVAGSADTYRAHALLDIASGEELVMNYHSFGECPDWLLRIMRDHFPEPEEEMLQKIYEEDL